jgi:hypothetical protein
MQFRIAAAFALLGTSSLAAQSIPDLTYATPLAGTWTYAPASDGSEAVFADATGRSQLWVHCAHAARRVTIAKSASTAAPLLGVWTSSQTRSVPARFSPATARLTIDLGAYDALLDAIANSRGRVGFVAGAQPPLVAPSWPEVARVIEDCRA